MVLLKPGPLDEIHFAPADIGLAGFNVGQPLGAELVEQGVVAR